MRTAENSYISISLLNKVKVTLTKIFWLVAVILDLPGPHSFSILQLLFCCLILFFTVNRSLDYGLDCHLTTCQCHNIVYIFCKTGPFSCALVHFVHPHSTNLQVLPLDGNYCSHPNPQTGLLTKHLHFHVFYLDDALQ